MWTATVPSALVKYTYTKAQYFEFVSLRQAQQFADELEQRAARQGYGSYQHYADETTWKFVHADETAIPSWWAC